MIAPVAGCRKGYAGSKNSRKTVANLHLGDHAHVKRTIKLPNFGQSPDTLP